MASKTPVPTPESVERVTLPTGSGPVDAPVTLGHFQIGRRLGGGGMGVVFEARDTVLERTVAIKLVRPGKSGERSRARLLREAQALARLKHPNVVTVFEVGASGDEIFIAMEFVAGGTLREWMREAHGWREVADVFLAIGRGLAAAHALGLVHRDVKPSNIFIDQDGTPKVGDFGLVSSSGALDEEGSESEPGPVLEGSLTTTGSVLGTPAYMSPERVKGQRADARADQFAYCVSLHQALTGQMPGQLGQARPVPPILRPILARGLDPRADARYPSMDALLEDLSRARRGRTRQWLAFGGAAAVVALAAGAWALARSRDPCPIPAAKIDAVWGDTRRAALRKHVLAVDSAQGAARIATVQGSLDPFVRGFREMHVDACRATRVRGTQSDTMLDLRMRCLERRFAGLEEGVALLAAAASVPALDRAVVGLVQLAPLDACADTAALAAAAPLPDQPEARAAAEQLARRIQQISARRRGGALDGLPKLARAAVDEARALGHGPTLAAALAELSRVQLAVYDTVAAGATARELTQVAARAHDDRDEAFAWTKLVGIVGVHEGKADQGLALVPAASAAVLRAGEPVDLLSDLLSEQGKVLVETPRAAEGTRKHEEARALLEKAGAAVAGSPLAPRFADVHFAIAGAKLRTGDEAGAVAGYRRAIELYRELYGPDSADEAKAWHNIAETLRQGGKLDGALEAAENAVRIKERRVGESPDLAMSVVTVATTLCDRKQWAPGLAAYERAMRIQGSQLPEGDLQRIPAMIGRARALVHVGRLDEAARGYDDTIALMERAGLRSSNLPITIFNRAELNTQRGHCGDALPDYARAIGLFEEARGKEAGILVYPLVGEARCLLVLERPADAIAPLERVRGLRAPGSAAAMVALARFFLDRALVESGRDRSRALADARAAREAVAAAGGDAEDLRDIDRWLASRHKSRGP